MLNYCMIGKRIGETRRKRNISQAELAELADLSVSYISYIENAKKKASLKALDIIADVMEITVDMLLTGGQNRFRDNNKNEVWGLIQDCSNYERRIIFEQIFSLKNSLRNNEGIRKGKNND